MFLGSAREIWPPGERGSTTPQNVPTTPNRWRKELILQVSVAQPSLADQPKYRLRLGNSSGQGLFTRHTFEGRRAALDRLTDRLDVLDPRVIGTTDPDRIDRRVSHHGPNRLECTSVTDVEGARQRRRRLGVRGVRAPDATDICLTHADHRLDVKLANETAADEADTESF